MKKNLTLHYCLNQVFYWAAIGGVVSFAASYLLSQGFTAAQIGWILFGAYILSFLLQPVVGAYADRAEKNVLNAIILALCAVSALCFVAVMLIPAGKLIFALLYLVGVLALDMQVPLMNSLSVYYPERGYKLNYGLGRGMGGFGYALAALGYGYLIEYLGEKFMVAAALVFIVLSAVMAVTYPKTEYAAEGEALSQKQDTSTLIEFFAKYKWYCVSLLGVLLLGMFHVMTENYFIEIFKRIGGDNSNVGTALFIATVTELPTMAVFTVILNKLGIKKIMLVSAGAFMLKAVLLIFATSVTQIYLIQITQCANYVFIAMGQVYYAEECIDSADMIKGQSTVTASYTLGCAVGNLAGGVIISASGVAALLNIGFGVTVLALAVLIVTLPKALKKAA